MTFADLIYKIFAYLYNNKQAILGGLVTAIAYVQGSEHLRNILSPEHYAWLMFVVGLAMVVFARSTSGGVVSKVMPSSVPADRGPPPQPPASPESGFARVEPLAVIALLGLVIVGCQSTVGAYKTADTVSEQAFVLTEHYAALVHEAADLKENPSTPQDVKDALRNAANATAPFIIGDEDAGVPGLRELAKAYDDVKSAETRDALQKALDQAILKVAELVRALKKAQAATMTHVSYDDQRFALAGGE